ncbi:hypothetical protein KCP71_10530 [Salmonella enterica subsp. enterica]|nr:hypothetical protein KCP71_10530 [Salmonella enterica subsp. enterica]
MVGVIIDSPIWSSPESLLTLWTPVERRPDFSALICHLIFVKFSDIVSPALPPAPPLNTVSCDISGTFVREFINDKRRILPPSLWHNVGTLVLINFPAQRAANEHRRGEGRPLVSDISQHARARRSLGEANIVDLHCHGGYEHDLYHDLQSLQHGFRL